MPNLEREQYKSEKVLFDLLDQLSEESANRIIEDIQSKGVELDFENRIMRKKDA